MEVDFPHFGKSCSYFPQQTTFGCSSVPTGPRNSLRRFASENQSEQPFPSFGKPTPYLCLRLRVSHSAHQHRLLLWLNLPELLQDLCPAFHDIVGLSSLFTLNFTIDVNYIFSAGFTWSNLVTMNSSSSLSSATLVVLVFNEFLQIWKFLHVLPFLPYF